MSVSWCCLDNDIILKLGTYGLFDHTLSSLSINYTQVKILETFIFKFEKHQTGNRKKDIEMKTKYDLEKALEIARKCTMLSENNLSATDIDIVSMLSSIKLDNGKKVDRGEAVLINEVRKTNEKVYLLTGDKSCLIALANSGLIKIIHHFTHKVWCLEQLILKNIDIHGFNCVMEKITSVKQSDKTIEIILSPVNSSQEEECIKGLKSYIEDLRTKTGNLLYPYP